MPNGAQQQFDPYVLSESTVQEPPRTLGQALRKIGPGLILAGAIVGTGELIATTHVGAKAGFALLWLVILSCFIKIFVQVELGRYTISSGDTTLESLGRLPGPSRLLGWWWLIMMMCTQFQLAAMVGGIGQAAHVALPGVSGRLGVALRPELPWAVLVVIVTGALLAMGSYKMVERGTTALVVVFTLMTVGCVALLPWTGHAFGWREIASGLSFQIPSSAVGAAVA
ncbi:MAG: Nramp family divalent metal transporter, partial [Anaerolineales bacterium]